MYVRQNACNFNIHVLYRTQENLMVCYVVIIHACLYNITVRVIRACFYVYVCTYT